MRLKTLMKLIKNNFMVDEELRVYIFADTIEFIDYTSAIKQDDKEICSDFCGNLFTIYHKNNIILTIEHNCLKMITGKNRELYKFLVSLINQDIEDLNNYERADKSLELRQIKNYVSLN